MSAIIAGKCKKCKLPFYVSLGHPEWWKQRKGREYTIFLEVIKSRLCLECFDEVFCGTLKLKRKYKANGEVLCKSLMVLGT